MPWGAVVGAAIGLYGASKQSSAAKSAANTQAKAADQASQVQQNIYNQQRADNEPFRQNALTAQQEYMNLLGLGQPAAQPAVQPQGVQTNTSGAFANNPFDGSRLTAQRPFAGYNPKISAFGDTVQPLGGQASGQLVQQPAASSLTPAQQQQAAFDRFRNTPGYQFGLQTGFNQVQSSAAARGGLYSGATLKALQRYGNDYADQQGYTPYMNRLASLAGMGQTANSQNAQAGQNYANQTGYNLMNAANARASGINQSADAWGQAASGIGGLVGKYWGGGWGGV